MLKLAQLGLLLTLFFIIKDAQAGLLVEPVVGYNFSSKSEFETPTNTTVNTSGGKGTSYGGRLGYQKLGFQIGLDYLRSTLDMQDNKVKSNLTSSEFAGFVGFEFPILLRVYAGYIFSANADVSLDNGSNTELKYNFSKGSGTKLGIGFTTLPFLDINVEFRRVSFDEYEAGGTDYTKSASYNTIMVGASLPFVL